MNDTIKWYYTFILEPNRTVPIHKIITIVTPSFSTLRVEADNTVLLTNIYNSKSPQRVSDSKVFVSE